MVHIHLLFEGIRILAGFLLRHLHHVGYFELFGAKRRREGWQRGLGYNAKYRINRHVPVGHAAEYRDGKSNDLGGTCAGVQVSALRELLLARFFTQSLTNFTFFFFFF